MKISDTFFFKVALMQRAQCWFPPFLAAMLISPASAAVVVDGTRVVLDARRGNDVTVTARNNGNVPALVQVWIDAGDAGRSPDDIRTPFQLTPVEPRLIQDQQSQAYRLTYAPHPADPALASDRESLFYFNLLDIPPKPREAQGSNLLQFAVRSRMKLFFRPAGLPGQPAAAAAGLRWSTAPDGAPQLRVHNPSPYHVTLTRISLADGKELAAEMVAPFGTLHVALPDTDTRPATISYAWLDDHGAEREAKAHARPADDTAIAAARSPP